MGYKKIILMVIMIFGLLMLFGCSLFKIADCDSSLGDCNISGNEGSPRISEVSNDNLSLPEGYTLDSYTIEEVMDTPCKQNPDCETPMEYLVQSRCPFTSLCLENRCTVVCPDIETMEFAGKITDVSPQMDGSILTVTEDGVNYEVLVSIPKFGEEYVSSMDKIEVGRYIKVIGNVLKFKETKRIIASQIYVEDDNTGELLCSLEPDTGPCKAAMPKYYFDEEEQECKEFTWGGCEGTVPFDNLDECLLTCENVIFEKENLTVSRCESDGGRVVNTLNDSCEDFEVNIGIIEDDVDCPCICCMISGGSAEASGKND
jgi:hypothetical protein